MIQGLAFAAMLANVSIVTRLLCLALVEAFCTGKRPWCGAYCGLPGSVAGRGNPVIWPGQADTPGPAHLACHLWATGWWSRLSSHLGFSSAAAVPNATDCA